MSLKNMVLSLMAFRTSQIDHGRLATPASHFLVGSMIINNGFCNAQAIGFNRIGTAIVPKPNFFCAFLSAKHRAKLGNHYLALSAVKLIRQE